MMKIQIEVDLDESEWEYLGVVPPEHGDKFLSQGEIVDAKLEGGLFGYSTKWPTFRRRRSWKEGIVWPRMLKAGFVVRDPDSAVFWFESKPTVEIKCWDGALPYARLDPDAFDLSFLPLEFWSVSYTQSLCEVKHDN